MSNSTLGKHFFVIHSPLTVMLCKMIMARRGLQPEQVYVAVNNSIEELSRKVLALPAAHYLNDQNIGRSEGEIINGKLNLDQYVSFGQDYFRKVFKMLGIDFEFPPIDPTLTADSPALIPTPEQIPEADKFTIYLPHLLNVRTVLTANLPWCKEVCLFEDGSMNYANLDHIEDVNLKQRYLEALQEKPYMAGKFTGVFQYYYERGFKIDSLVGSQHKDNHSPKIYVLSDLAYYYIDYGYPLNKDILDYHQLLNLEEIKAVLPHYSWHDLRQRILNTPLIKHNKLIQQMLADPLNINNKINLIIFEGKNGTVSQEDYLNAMHNLIKEVKKKGIFFAFVKHHPLLVDELRTRVEALLSQEQMLVEIVPDHVALELEFMLEAENSMIIHSAASSVMLYGALFNQIVIPYNHLIADIKHYRKLIKENDFDIPKLVATIYQIGNQKIT